MRPPTYLTPQQLLAHLRNSNLSRTVVIDVREADRAGGHIRGSLHIPAPIFRADPSAHLAATQGADRVIFHCMYSQVRGPACAAAYAHALHAVGDTITRKPEVCVLSDGFAGVARLAVNGGTAADIVDDLDNDLYAVS